MYVYIYIYIYIYRLSEHILDVLSETLCDWRDDTPDTILI